jgi:molecular chaperone HscB
MKLDSNDFELFDLPVQFEQQLDLIDARWRALQAQVHPDRFVSQGAAAQRVAMQWSVRVNEGYRRLKDPLKRAAYLCELQGHPLNAESNTQMLPEFLMQQMAWREELDAAISAPALQALEDEIRAARAEALKTLAHTLDTLHNPQQAAQQVRQLMFIERILRDVDQRTEK